MTIPHTKKPLINKASTVKAVDVFKKSKKWIDDPKKLEEFARSEDPNLRTNNELKDLKRYQDSTNIYHPSYGTYKEHTVGTTAHRKKYPERYGGGYTSKLEQAAYPKAGTAPSERAAAKKLSDSDRRKIHYQKLWGLNKEPLVKQFRNDDPSTYLTDVNQQKGMLIATLEDAKPKSKKINQYADVKIPIPVIDHALLRDPKHDARDAALKKLREYAFTPTPNPDAVRGIGSFKDTVGRKLKAATSRSDWEKNNRRTYE